MATDAIGKLLAEFSSLESARAPWNSVWQEAAEYVLPRRANFTGKYSPGSTRTRKVFDSTPIHANDILANGLQSTMTSMSQRWFYLMPNLPEKEITKDVRVWTESATEALYRNYRSPDSAFYSQGHEVYLDTGALGTGVLFSDERVGGMRYSGIPLSECYLITNFQGLVVGIMRKYELTLSQIMTRDGWNKENLPEEMKTKWQNGTNSSDTYEILHVVKESTDSTPEAIKSSLGYYSIHILIKNKYILSKSGFNEFPFHVFRWVVRTGEVYGYSPAMLQMADIRMLNEMQKTLIKAAHRAVDPPLQAPDQGFIGGIRTKPGGVNYYRPGTNDRIEAIDSGVRPDIGLELLTYTQKRIESGFLNDAFDTTSDSDGVNVKATFAIQRREERFRRLGAVVSRCQSEYLGSVIRRDINSMMRRGLIPQPPDKVRQGGIKMEYISPMARAQRSTEADDILRGFEILAPYAEGDPSVFQNFDSDELAHYVAELYSFPTRIMRDIGAVKAERTRQQQTDQILTAIEGGQGVASGIKDVATAEKIRSGG